MGRYTHTLFLKANTKLILPHKNLYLFFSAHGTFNNLNYTNNKTTSQSCVCGSVSSPDHCMFRIINNANLYKFRNPFLLQLNQWNQLILKKLPFFKENYTMCRLSKGESMHVWKPSPYFPSQRPFPILTNAYDPAYISVSWSLFTQMWLFFYIAMYIVLFCY